MEGSCLLESRAVVGSGFDGAEPDVGSFEEEAGSKVPAELGLDACTVGRWRIRGSLRPQEFLQEHPRHEAPMLFVRNKMQLTSGIVSLVERFAGCAAVLLSRHRLGAGLSRAVVAFAPDGFVCSASGRAHGTGNGVHGIDGLDAPSRFRVEGVAGKW